VCAGNTKGNSKGKCSKVTEKVGGGGKPDKQKEGERDGASKGGCEKLDTSKKVMGKVLVKRHQLAPLAREKPGVERHMTTSGEEKRGVNSCRKTLWSRDYTTKGAESKDKKTYPS